MKPTIPSVSTQLWEDLYDEASAYQKLAPWTVLDENHIFAVEDPVSEEIVYCSVLGAIGEFYGLVVYRGRSGHEMHWKVKSSLLDPNNTNIRSAYNALALEFCHIEELDKEDRTILKRIGFGSKERQRYAQFRSYIPGYQSWYLNEEEVKSFIFVLQAAIEHVKKSRENPLFLTASKIGEYSLYLPQIDSPSTSWNTTRNIPETLSQEEEMCWVSKEKIQSLQAKPQDKDMAWEASIFTGPAAIYDRERPYWLRVALIVDRNSQMIMGMDIIKPEDGAVAILMEKLVFSFEKSHYLPGYILFDDLELCDSFSSILSLLHIQTIATTDMAATHNVQHSLKEKIAETSFLRELSRASAID